MSRRTASTGCATLVSWPTGCARRNSPSAARCSGTPRNLWSSKRRGPPSPLRGPRGNQGRCVRSVSTGACSWFKQCIAGQRRGTSPCQCRGAIPHSTQRRSRRRLCLCLKTCMVSMGVVRPQSPARHLSRGEWAKPWPWSMTWIAHIDRLHAPAAEEATSVHRITKAPQPSTIAIASAV